MYADSSALVKLVIDEPESDAVAHYAATVDLATSRVALVEVPRATRIANPDREVQRATQGLLHSCLLIDVTDGLLRAASQLASRSVRTLDAIHIASAERIQADELIAYDRRLCEAGIGRGLAVVSPGA